MGAVARYSVRWLRAANARASRRSLAAASAHSAAMLAIAEESSCHSTSSHSALPLLHSRRGRLAPMKAARPSLSSSLSQQPRKSVVELSAQGLDAQALSAATQLVDLGRVLELREAEWRAIFKSCAQLQVDIAPLIARVAVALPASVATHDQQPIASRLMWISMGAAIQCCVVRKRAPLALMLYAAAAKVDHAAAADASVFVSILKAARATGSKAEFKAAYRAMIHAKAACSEAFDLAVDWCCNHVDCTYLKEVLADAMAAEHARDDGRRYLSLGNYNQALQCFLTCKRDTEARELCAQMLDHPTLRLNQVSMMLAVESHRTAPSKEVLELVRKFVEDRHLAPNLHVFTAILAICARRRLFDHAEVVWATMRAQDLPLDTKAYMTMAAIYAAKDHLAGIVGLLDEMQQREITATAAFFQIIFRALCRFDRIDRCLSLLSEMSRAGKAIPRCMYEELVRVGIKLADVSHTVEAMELMVNEGHLPSSELAVALIRRCNTDADATELARMIAALESSKLVPFRAPLFSCEVYDELETMKTRVQMAPQDASSGMSKKDADTTTHMAA